LRLCFVGQMVAEDARKRRRLKGKVAPQFLPREVKCVGFLGVSDYGLGQLKVLASRYRVLFATAKAHSVPHAEGLEGELCTFCASNGIEYLGAADANSEEIVKRSRATDLVIIGGYDAILKGRILDAPRHGVLNTHLGVLPLNRGCCPTLWAQLHKLPQGFTTYLVGRAIDHGGVLDSYMTDALLGGVRDNNRVVYDTLAREAVARFSAALDRFERGDPLRACDGEEAYHRKGMPNDGWISWEWSDAFLRRFSLALDFPPYLPGRTRIQGQQEAISLSVEGPFIPDTADKTKPAGSVLRHYGEEDIVVRTRECAVRCRVRSGVKPAVHAQLCSLGSIGRHGIDLDFCGDVLPLDRYLCAPAVLPEQRGE